MTGSSNGSNPRLDRIEKLIHESERANKEAHARMDRSQVQFERNQARFEARFEKSQAEFEKRMALSDKRMDRFERDMRRWAALGVQEARKHRTRMQEIDKKIDQLASSHVLTEETLRRFISSLERGGGNGHRRRG